MSVQRIVHAASGTKGWQARVYTRAPKYVSAFFSDSLHGGSRKAKDAAIKAERKLKRMAASARREAT